MLYSDGMKLQPFLERVATIVCQNGVAQEVDATGVVTEEGDRFFYLGGGYWRCIVRAHEYQPGVKIGWEVYLVNPGVKRTEVKAVEEATAVILCGGRENKWPTLMELSEPDMKREILPSKPAENVVIPMQFGLDDGPCL